MIGWTSPTHIVLLLLIALLLFGAKRLPEIGRSLGHGMREFKDSVSGHDHSQADETPAQLGRSLGQGVRELKESVTGNDHPAAGDTPLPASTVATREHPVDTTEHEAA
jgi:sec-independent protein translocase protein TatA